MIIEFLKYGYDRAFLYPRRFLTLIIVISITTFSLLILVTTLDSVNNATENILNKLENNDPNMNQIIIYPKRIQEPVTLETLNQISKYPEFVNGYFYEDLTYSLEKDDFLAPWIEWNDQLNLRTHPIFLHEVSAKSYGLGKKIVYGSFFTGEPYEIIISTNLLQRFINKSEVFQEEIYLLDDAKLNQLEDGKGNHFKPEEIVGKTITLTYNTNLISEKNEKNKGMIGVIPKGIVQLKVIGVYDPNLGYQTIGDVWLPYSLKQNLSDLGKGSSSNLGSQLAIRTENLTNTLSLLGKTRELSYITKQSKETSALVIHDLKTNQIKHNFFQISIVAAVVVSALSLSAICFLITMERRYDFTLQRALGANRKKIASLFIWEIFFITFIGEIVGLLLTFTLLWSGFRDWLNIPQYIEIRTFLYVVIAIFIVNISVAMVTVYWLLHRNVIYGLSGGE